MHLLSENCDMPALHKSASKCHLLNQYITQVLYNSFFKIFLHSFDDFIQSSKERKSQEQSHGTSNRANKDFGVVNEVFGRNLNILGPQPKTNLNLSRLGHGSVGLALVFVLLAEVVALVEYWYHVIRIELEDVCSLWALADLHVGVLLGSVEEG